MKKSYLTGFLLFFLAFAASGQGWIVYNCSVLPDQSVYEFSESNTGGDQYSNMIVDDQSNPGNKFLQLLSPQEDPGKFMWKYNLPNDENDPITVILKLKGLSDTLDRTMEIDIQTAGFRERLYLKNDTTYELKEAGVKDDLPGSPLEWHIVRMTKDGDAVSFYWDEDPTAVAIVTTTTTTSSNYFRFGDGNGSSTLGALVDWVIWDTTGAYAPGEGAALPEEPSWVMYTADVTPDQDAIDFGESNTGGDQYSNAIVEDPDVSGNNLLQLISPQADPGKFMWKHNLPNDVNDPITVVMRVKGSPDTLDRTMEIDLQQAGFRERLYLKNDNTYELKQAGVKDDLPCSPLDWHIFRMTKWADHVAVYIDENPVAVAEVTTEETSSENYFRFGDGNGSSTLGALVDWVIWDTTGAYAPGEGNALPSALVTEVPSWVIYTADVTPDEDAIDFGESNVDGDPASNTILDDPDNEGNKLLELISPGADPGKFMWKHNLPNDENDPITLVARIKSAEGAYDRTMEFDIQQAGYRERLYLKNDGTYELKQAGMKGDFPVNVANWHIIRITKWADHVAVYIDEDPEPFAEVVTEETSSSNYFRFGDGNGSSTLGGLIDWIAWDTTGAYAPDRGTFLPSTLVLDVADETGISDLTRTHLAKVYPNPAGDLIMVEFEGTRKAAVEVYDMVGKMVMHRTIDPGVSTVDIGALRGGMYMIRISSENRIDVHRFIKQ